MISITLVRYALVLGRTAIYFRLVDNVKSYNFVAIEESREQCTVVFAKLLQNRVLGGWYSTHIHSLAGSL